MPELILSAISNIRSRRRKQYLYMRGNECIVSPAAFYLNDVLLWFGGRHHEVYTFIPLYSMMSVLIASSRSNIGAGGAPGGRPRMVRFVTRTVHHHSVCTIRNMWSLI